MRARLLLCWCESLVVCVRCCAVVCLCVCPFQNVVAGLCVGLFLRLGDRGYVRLFMCAFAYVCLFVNVYLCVCLFVNS